jgi:uncharacterized DUF497 family protein
MPGETMRIHDEFEWDSEKARSNERKHGFRFEVAMRALSSEKASTTHYEIYDDAHSKGETRYITFAPYPLAPPYLLMIVWTERLVDHKRITRIISVRGASRPERKQYAKAIKGK